MRIFEPFFTPRTPPVTPSADHEHRVSATPSEHKLKEEATVKSVPILSRDSRQYHANIIVKVEETLFSIPAHHFRSSAIFRDYLQDHPILGSSDEHPLDLSVLVSGGTVTAEHFRWLVGTVQQDASGSTVRHNRRELNIEQWVWVFRTASVLSLAHIRAVATSEIGRLDVSPAMKAGLAYTHKVRNWAYTELPALLERDAPLDFEEAKMLGLEWAVKLGQMREVRAASQDCSAAISSSFFEHFQLISLELIASPGVE